MLSQEYKQKVYFVLPSRFPTQKAFGVTTEYSAQAVTKLGYQVYIIAPEMGDLKNTSNQVFILARYIAKILLSRRLKRFNKIRFYTFIVYFAFLIRFRLRASDKIFWCRDIFLTYLLALKSKSYFVCEIHRSPNGVNKYLLKLLTRNSRVVIAPIANFLSNEYKLDQSRKVFAPMGINQDELIYFDSTLQKKEKKIVYVGHSHQVGTPLNVDLINNAAIKINLTHPDWSIELLGIGMEYFRNNISSEVSSNILIHGFVPRSKVLKSLATSSIGLIIYPEIKWLNDSFPIKTVEYAAASLAIIASDTQSHRRILNETQCLFFDLNSTDALSNSIDFLINNSKHARKIATNARLWANEFTYEKRVKNVLNLLSTLISKSKKLPI